MVCIACISVFGFLIALVAKFLSDFLGISYFKSSETCDIPKQSVKGDKTEQVSSSIADAPTQRHVEADAEDEDENPFAKESAFGSEEPQTCPFSGATQSKTKKRD